MERREISYGNEAKFSTNESLLDALTENQIKIEKKT